MATALHLAQEAQGIFDAADAKNRPLTGEERNRVDELLERAQEHHKAEQSLKAINAAFGAGGPGVHLNDPNVTWGGGGPGDMFIASQGYKNLVGPVSGGRSSGPRAPLTSDRSTRPGPCSRAARAPG